MVTEWKPLMEPRTRMEPDEDFVNPWTEQIAPLFNDKNYHPEALEQLLGGVTRADTACMYPEQRLFERDSGVLKRNLAAFKSEYETCLSHYEASGTLYRGSLVGFARGHTHLTCAFCFPLATRARKTDAQREEGILGGVVTAEKL